MRVIIIKVYFKNILFKMKSNSKNISHKNTFNCLKSNFSCKKNKSNTLNSVQSHYHSFQLIAKCKPKRQY